MNETNYRNQLQVDLSAAGFRMFRNNVGVFFTNSGTPTRCGLCKGSGDLIGIAAGRFVSIETKSKTGVIRKEQQAWADMINKMGGIAIFARPGDDVVGMLTDRLKGI